MELITTRLIINQLDYNDTDFLIALLNQPSFIQYIGEHDVNDDASARKFLLSGPLSTYPDEIGMYCVRDKKTEKAIGLCGLMKRDFLPMPDIGYAFLESAHGNGFAYEAANAFIDKVKQENKYHIIAAMTSLINDASIGLLTKLNFIEITPKPPIGALKDSRYFELPIHQF